METTLPNTINDETRLGKNPQHEPAKTKSAKSGVQHAAAGVAGAAAGIGAMFVMGFKHPETPSPEPIIQPVQEPDLFDGDEVPVAQTVNDDMSFEEAFAATLPLPTNDMLMSRSHATIEVIAKAEGLFEHRLSDLGGKNGTFHNNKLLEKNDIIILSPGDIIKFGNTSFTLLAD